MANVLKRDKQISVISLLLEGSSVRSAERLTGVHRDSICRLMVRVGTAAGRYSSRTLRDLPCKRIEVDEIWAFVQKKNKNVSPADDWTRVGDQYTFVALDPETKLIPSYLVGKRTAYTAMQFMDDLASRLRNRVQLSSDGFLPYVHAAEHAFGKNGVDYGTVVKEYVETHAGRGRYSPPSVINIEKDEVMGWPNLELVSTSLVERQNLTIRTHCRRLTRWRLASRRSWRTSRRRWISISAFTTSSASTARFAARPRWKPAWCPLRCPWAIW